MTLVLGCIADDFTGATDLANTLVGQGMRAVQVIGVPDAKIDIGEAEAVVVALKSRTNPVPEAVAQSVEALRWLIDNGARQVFFKYCSTFDSTDQGNIGPVADALLEVLGSDFTIACPAFPANGRTIYQGHLFVGDELLSDSAMKDHPLTPMRDANLVSVLGRQTESTVGLVPFATVSKGGDAIAAAYDDLKGDGVRYAIVDALNDDDLLAIGEASRELALITGGSGVALGLAENFRRAGLLGEKAISALPAPRGRRAVLSGSCSVATRGQVAAAQNIWPVFKLDPLALDNGSGIAAKALAWAANQDPATPVLIYSSADPQEVGKIQHALGRDRAGAMVEKAFGQIAKGLVEGGVRQLIVAGGETSGAVIQALGVAALRIGPEIDPGVPWTETLDEPTLALALKSGNFGAEDFFQKAFEMLS
jgi:uncharacterized protein YgbK (DUF1537 family)